MPFEDLDEFIAVEFSRRGFVSVEQGFEGVSRETVDWSTWVPENADAWANTATTSPSRTAVLDLPGDRTNRRKYEREYMRKRRAAQREIDAMYMDEDLGDVRQFVKSFS